MNNNWFKAIIGKVFRSGQPLYFYIGLNVAVFLAAGITTIIVFLSGGDAGTVSALIDKYLALPASIHLLPVRFYTLLTYQFLHSGIMHLLFNMLVLYWTGIIFSDFFKPRQFHFVYLAGGIAGGLLYVAAYNIFPAFAAVSSISVLVGSSAAVMGIAAAAATMVPNYQLRLMFFGFVRLKYLVIALLVIDILMISSTNPGGSFAHIGGALAGFAYVKLLRSGIDLTSWFKRNPKLRVVKNDKYTTKSRTLSDQDEIDKILDKISSSGYDKLTKEEKERLFKASHK